MTLKAVQPIGEINCAYTSERICAARLKRVQRYILRTGDRFGHDQLSEGFRTTSVKHSNNSRSFMPVHTNRKDNKDRFYDIYSRATHRRDHLRIHIETHLRSPVEKSAAI